MFLVSKSLEDSKKIAEDLVGRLSSCPRTSATIVALSGDLGAGKTTLAQLIAAILGVRDRVTSPTYVISKIYDTSHKIFKKLVHIDAYRLTSGADLMSLGWEKILEDKNAIVVVEWPERIAEILPSDIVRIEIDVINDTTRNIDIFYGEKENH